MKNTLFKIIAGNIVSQVIGLISVPLLLSLYSASDLGYYGFFISASALLSAFISLRIENLMFSVSLREARALFFLASTFLVIALIASGVVSYFILLLYSERALYCSALFGAIGLAQFNVAYGFVVRQGRTNRHIAGRVIRNLGELAAITGCMIAHCPITVLPWLISLTYVVAAVFLSLNVAHFRLSECSAGILVLKRNMDFLRYDSFASLLNAASLNLPVLFFYRVGEAEISGIFFSVSRVLGTPALMIAQSIGTTLKQHASVEKIQQGTCKNSIQFVVDNVIRRWLPTYLLIGLAVVVGTYVWQSGITNITLVVTMLVPMFFARYIYNCLGSIVYVLRLQRDSLMFQSFLFAAVAGSLFLPAFVLTSLMLYSITGILVYSVFFFRLLRFAR